ncbi:MAG: Uma2 family endonuclease [Polyangiaceae bacterium]|nr:Uma2 family endonuclease [Polyangiaceae bacterium]
MSVTDVSEDFAYGGHLYVKAPKRVFFRSEETLEEAVSETKRHLEARTTLYLLMREALSGAAIGSEQFVYFDAEDPRKCLSPDVFVKLGSTDTTFDNWKVWENGAPEVAVEIVSAWDRPAHEWSDKLQRYRSSGVRELVRFDPEEKNFPIRVWDRVDGDLVERSRRDPTLRECVALGLWWTVAPSGYGPMLRLARDKEGTQLLTTPDEERKRLAQEIAEERKARSLAEHERKLAEHERKLEAEARQVEAEARVKAEHERALAEQRAHNEADARKLEAEARVKAERERDLALAELKKLQAKAAKPSTKRR